VLSMPWLVFLTNHFGTSKCRGWCFSPTTSADNDEGLIKIDP